MVPDQIVDQIVTLIGLSKIFFCVIDNAIGADRFHKIDIARAADSSRVCAKRLRDLDGESANATGRAVDQNFLSGLNVPFVAQTLQCRERSNRNRTGLLKGDVRRLQNRGAISGDADVIGHGSSLRAENFVARFEVGYIFSNCFYGGGEVTAESVVLGLS